MAHSLQEGRDLRFGRLAYFLIYSHPLVIDRDEELDEGVGEERGGDAVVVLEEAAGFVTVTVLTPHLRLTDCRGGGGILKPITIMPT